MALEEVRKRLSIETASSGLDKTASDINKVADAEARLTVESQKTERAQLSMEGAFAKLERRYVDGVRQQQELEKVQRQVNAAVAQNPALQERANAVMAGAAQRINAVNAANRTVTQSTGLARHELINLSRQAQDVGVSLASGQSPLMVLAQQGTQIADIFASSQTTMRSFFSQAAGWAGTFLKSTGGIATAVLAIGGAALYAASQFARASTTIEQALEEQNRLLKEGKALLDQRTSLEARAQLQSKEQTQFETLRNQLDLQVKLNQAMEEAANISRRRATRPTEVPGEMGVAPTGFAALSDPGLDKMTAAFQALKEAQAAGLPGLKQYNAELAKIGLAHPELALIVQDMIKAGEEGLKLEFAAQRAKAMSDALAGIATNAQLAAVGLGSVAQFQVNNQQAKEAAEATERQAQATLRLAQIYPGVTIETAKQLEQLNAQLGVAQAITGAAQMEAQHRATVVTLLAQGKSLTEAIAIADAQRAISLAQVNAEADRTLKNLQEQGAIIRAVSEEERGRIRAAQEYNKLIEQGVDAQKAGQIAAQMQANARATQDAREETDSWTVANDNANRALQRTEEATLEAAWAAQRYATAVRRAREELERFGAAGSMAFGKYAFIPFGNTGRTDLFTTAKGTLSQFDPAGYNLTEKVSGPVPNLTADVDKLLQEGGGTQGAFLNLIGGDLLKQGTQTLNDLAGKRGAMTITGGGEPTLDTDKIAMLDRLIALMPEQDQIRAYQMELQKVQQTPQTLARDELIRSLTDKITALTQATDELRQTNETITDVLSPYYSQDPRATHLGFRAFAGGGIMTQYGELPLKKYDGGGIASSAQVAMFGEGSVPEAYVPVPSGKIPVEMRMPANSNEEQSQQRPIIVNVSMTANVSRDEARRTGFQIAQSMKRSLGS